jgi:thioesterase domain-containing protein
VADIVLVHSPLLGPLSVQRTGAELDRLGHRINAPDLRPVWSQPGPWLPQLAEMAAAPGEVDSGEGSVILLGHSGAGPLLPAIADRIAKWGRDVEALIFVDAGLPYPGRSWNQTAPSALVTQVHGLSSHGLVRPWHEWFLPEVMEAVVPDSDQRAALEAEDPQVPLGFFAEHMPADEWAGPGGYLLLSEGYADDASEAAAYGWLVETLDSDHLAMYTQPEQMAAAIDRLIVALG